MIALVTWVSGLLHGVRESFAMFWATWWALVLGFSLSGMVQAFVPRSTMSALLGRPNLGSVLRATGLGAASSSCSYAASAMSRSLVARGADFTTAMVFLFASTNLVIELGIVLVVLVGWTFMAAEFVGGLLMVLLLSLVGSRAFSARFERRVREHLGSEELTSDPGVTERPWRHLAGWIDAATYAVADITMLRRELLIGYGVAGFLAALVPSHWWADVFFVHHGAWSVLENALVGPIIAVISWVCSVGNVPLAAALWAGGISFGGVIGFIFADLISMPLILVYRRFFGWRVALTMAGVFYVVMVGAALATQGLFALAHLTPAHTTVLSTRPVLGVFDNVVNSVALVMAVAGWWLSRHRARFGAGQGYAIDPVCGMQVRTSDAPARTTLDDVTYYFCAPRCLSRFLVEHDPGAAALDAQQSATSTEHALDPVCGMTVDPASASASRVFESHSVYFCSPSCAEHFDASPGQYLDSSTSLEDPVCHMRVDPRASEGPVAHHGVDYWFCGSSCLERFRSEPDAFVDEPVRLDPVCHMRVDVATAAASREFEGVAYYFCSPSCASQFELAPERYLHPIVSGEAPTLG